MFSYSESTYFHMAHNFWESDIIIELGKTWQFSTRTKELLIKS